MSTLYIVDNKGQLRSWSIEAYDDGFEVEYGAVNGAMQRKFESVTEGKSNRNVYEQIDLMIESKIKKQKDRGYVETIEEALSGKATNASGNKKPMLAQKFESKYLDFKKGVFIQRKYDGNRCIIHNHPIDGIIAYSRNGKPINSISHILDGLNMPIGASIDGELYAHGYRLQEIVSWIKRKQEDSMKLQYHAYDYIANLPFEDRFKKLSDVKGNIQVVPTYAVATESSLYDYHDEFRSNGYEGSIIRLNNYSYEDGKRSRSLLKLKEFLDDEFLVIDVIPSKEDWGRLCCITSEGKHFRVIAPGTVYEKQEVLENKESYIGRHITVEYVYLTEDGIPFHPIAKCWR